LGRFFRALGVGVNSASEPEKSHGFGFRRVTAIPVRALFAQIAVMAHCSARRDSGAGINAPCAPRFAEPVSISRALSRRGRLHLQ
jgi:hypothetical protein